MRKTSSKKSGYWIFRAWKIVNGQKLWAKDYGYKAWPIWIEI